MANPSEHVNHSFSARFHDFSRDAGQAATEFAGRVYQVLISVKNFILTAIQNLYNLCVGTRPPGNQQRGNQNAIRVPLQTRVPTPGTSPADKRRAEIRDNLVRKLSNFDQSSYDLINSILEATPVGHLDKMGEDLDKYDVDTLNKASTLLKKLNVKFESLSCIPQILQAVADIAPEEREDVIDKACPLIQEGASSYNIAQTLKGIAAISKDQRQEKIAFVSLYLQNLPVAMEKQDEILFAFAKIPLDQLVNFSDKITLLSAGLTDSLPFLIENIADIYVKDSKFLEDICSDENMLLLMNQFTSGVIRAGILYTVKKLEGDKRQGAIEKTLQVLNSKCVALRYDVDTIGLLWATARISNDDWEDVFSKMQELLASNQGRLSSARVEALVLSAIAFIPKELREQALVLVKSLNHRTISKVTLIHAIASLTAVVAPEHFGIICKQLETIYAASQQNMYVKFPLSEVAKAIFNKKSDPSFIASSVAHSLKYMEEGRMPDVAIEALSELFEGLDENDPDYVRYRQLEQIGHNKDLL